jgi:hypothetical protein
MRISVYSFTLMALALYHGSAQSAEKTVKAGASLNYKYDDNIRVSPTNQITLSGLMLDGYVDAAYATPRFEAAVHLKLGIERYDNISLDSDDSSLEEPKTSDFDNESVDLNSEISYDWERHTLSLYGRYWRDSTLNTQFLDTGLGGFRQIEGASRSTTSTARTGWQWQITDRQLLDSSLQWQTVDYESALYVGYDYLSANSNWSYVLNERLRLQLQPYFSRFENDANVAVKSDTFGLQVGGIWSITEKWQLNALVGSSLVSSEYSGGGFSIFNPETGQIEFVELEDQDSTSFTGDVTLGFDEEYYGFSVNVSSAISPSGDGILRQNSEARLRYYWKPRERLRLDFDARFGSRDTTGDRVDDKRDYAEAGVRVGFQFAKDWWVSARYRYREQDYERNNLGKGDGNLFLGTVSYHLPEEIL